MPEHTFALEVEGAFHPIEHALVVGRSPDCDLVLANDERVSRLHARFSILGNSLWVEDLQSANGVFLDGRRVRGKATVSVGDTVLLGGKLLAVVRAGRLAVRRAATLPDIPAVRTTQRTAALGSHGSATETSANAPDHDWQPLRDAMRDGDLERAAALLRVALDRLLDEATIHGQLSPSARQEVCEHALMLASRTHDATWLNLLFHLHILLVQPLPYAVAAALPRLVHETHDLDTLALDAYVKTLRRRQSTMSSVDRQLCVALESALIIASKKVAGVARGGGR